MTEPTDSPAVPLTPADLEGASREALVHGATEIVGRCRANPGPESLHTLAELRTLLLHRNERSALALALRVQGQLAAALGQYTLAANAHDTEWGVRELLDQPFRAHRARLDHAEALFFAGLVDESARALRKAQQPARELALGGKVTEASIQLADTLARLAGVLKATGQHEEAELWLEGALDISPDDDTRELVRATPGRFVQPVEGPRSRTL